VLERVRPDDLRSLIDLLERMGCLITEREGADGKQLRIQGSPPRNSAPGTSPPPLPGLPHGPAGPGHGRDDQAHGISVIKETIFENRFQHAMELERLGATSASMAAAAQPSSRARPNSPAAR